MDTEGFIVCPACNGSETTTLPTPHLAQSMISDGRIVPLPLLKVSCNTCGHGFHKRQLTHSDMTAIYNDAYQLGRNAPHEEANRAMQYADTIFTFLNEADVTTPSKFIEFGCGMGSLMNVLAQKWACTQATGVEPSTQLVEAAETKASPNVSILQGFAEDFVPSSPEDYGLCISVNVIEHTLNPTEFLHACSAAISNDGKIVIICPDGEIASSELLFYDHISSFSLNSLRFFAQRSGLSIEKNMALDGPFAGFRIFLLSKQTMAIANQNNALEITHDRTKYLTAWSKAEEHVTAQTGAKPYAIFGIGEYADLLNAYTPSLVENAYCFTLDHPKYASCFGKDVKPFNDFATDGKLSILAAVNERSWPMLHSRFSQENIRCFHPIAPAP